MLARLYLTACSRLRAVATDERGDTNFISILIILGIVLLLAMVFMGFKDQIVEMVTGIVDSFTIH